MGLLLLDTTERVVEMAYKSLRRSHDAAGVLGPRDVLPVGPQPLLMSHCCAVMTQSPHTLLKERVVPHKKSRTAAQRSGGHRRVATRKATGDPGPTEERGDPPCVTEQCEGTCDRSLEEGVAHRRCVTRASRSQLRAMAAEKSMLPAQPFGAMGLLLGFVSLLPVFLGAPVTTVSGEAVVEYFVMGHHFMADAFLRTLHV